ncbi:MAG: DNA repair protein RecN [Bacteroidaceae bacterium]
MLRSLYIQNYALIQELDINFESGFSVITGETGAGKSIILGAVGLLLGQRADVKSIRIGAKKCVIEAHFNIVDYGLQPFFEEYELDYADECIFRRELLISGKSRAFINDTPVGLSAMKELGEHLIDIHSQHQNLLLNKEGFQLNVLDILARNNETLDVYRQEFNRWKKTKKELSELIAKAEKSRADEDYIRFQLQQLEEAKLVEGEQVELEQESDTLSHSEEIKAGLYKTSQIFASEEGGVIPLLKDCLSTLSDLKDVYKPSETLYNRLESSWIELRDIADEISSDDDSVEFNPQRLEEVNNRLNLIYSLEQKHHVNTDTALIGIVKDFRAKLEDIVSYEDRIEELKIRNEAIYNKVKEQADILTKSRKIAAVEVEKALSTRLVSLGMPNVRFRVALERKEEPGLLGMDAVIFLFSANKNGVLQNITSVASGGEIARVMLAVKALVARATHLPTIIFDEIDTGVSGSIADRMAETMEEIGGKDRQVISITHLPQIAAYGRVHYVVYKKDSDTETNSHIRRLTRDERIEEIAHMLSGTKITEAALDNAKSLLALHGN